MGANVISKTESTSTPEQSVAFLLGAGFNADANLEAGCCCIEYPLVPDLARICFGLHNAPNGKSVEDMFQDAAKARNKAPEEKLCEYIFKADDSIPHRLWPKCGSTNSYLRMLRDFPTAPILTFNYDSLVEILLLRLGLWNPGDGYGVPVKFDLEPLHDGSNLPTASSRPVLHLHGTLCVYTAGIEIIPGACNGNGTIKLSKSSFAFDPGPIWSSFGSYRKHVSGHYYADPEHQRIIAPVPDKSTGLIKEFVGQVNRRAVEAVQSAQEIIAIGYKFNYLDAQSYQHILHAASGKTVTVVAPDADETVRRMKNEFPKIVWRSIPKKFADWVASGYL